MILIIGGKYQGKLDYALSLGYTRDDVSTTLPNTKPILYGLQNLVRENPDLTLSDLSGEIILCDEVGCGVVPAQAEEREWRERTGRLCCLLAQEADTVVRLFCGIPRAIKGTLPQPRG